LPPAPEREVLRACLAALQALGIPCQRRNTGGMVNTRGQYVRFNDSGDSDTVGVLPATWEPMAGRMLCVEVKREGFRPDRLRGRALDHFRQQADKLRVVNRAGGVAFWVSSVDDLVRALEKIRAGWRVEIDSDGWPYLVNDLAGAQGQPRGLSMPEEVEPFG
jgi:hypothetical protein